MKIKKLLITFSVLIGITLITFFVLSPLFNQRSLFPPTQEKESIESSILRKNHRTVSISNQNNHDDFEKQYHTIFNIEYDSLAMSYMNKYDSICNILNSTCIKVNGRCLSLLNTKYVYIIIEPSTVGKYEKLLPVTVFVDYGKIIDKNEKDNYLFKNGKKVIFNGKIDVCNCMYKNGYEYVYKGVGIMYNEPLLFKKIKINK